MEPQDHLIYAPCGCAVDPKTNRSYWAVRCQVAHDQVWDRVFNPRPLHADEQTETN